MEQPVPQGCDIIEILYFLNEIKDVINWCEIVT